MQIYIKYESYTNFSNIAANGRVYDHLRCQIDSVSRYTKASQSENIRNLMPSN
jgi:hypothetical protein